MELKEIKKHENPLFNRKEIEVIAETQSNPKNTEAEKSLSEKYSVPVENIEVKSIKGHFGSNEFLITANIYSSKEEKEKTEVKSRKSRKGAEAKSEEKKG